MPTTTIYKPQESCQHIKLTRYKVISNVVAEDHLSFSRSVLVGVEPRSIVITCSWRWKALVLVDCGRAAFFGLLLVKVVWRGGHSDE